ncbi:MAG: glycosyltransferase family protein [Planctomycetota bacterium]|jgi:hypothetical protein
MHVLMVTSADRIEHEGAMLDRLADGLLAAGHAVTRVVPIVEEARPVGGAATSRAGERVLLTPFPSLPWVRRAHARRLADLMERQRPDAIYASGTDAWRLAIDLARALDRPLTLELWSMRQLKHVPRGRAASWVAAYLAPTTNMARALRSRVGPDIVGVARIGVPMPEHPRTILEDPQRAISLAVIGDGRDIEAWRAWLAGFADALENLPAIQAFMELPSAAEREVWSLLTRLDLHGQVSIIGEADRVSNLLVRCDALAMPERSGDARSLPLQAMAGGLPLLMAPDPPLDEMFPPDSVVRIARESAERWTEALRDLVARPDEARARGRAGRGHVMAQHRPQDQIDAILATLERTCTGGAYAFSVTQP